MTQPTADNEPFPDLSLYDPAELNEAAAKVTSELGNLIFSKRYRLAAKLLDAMARRKTGPIHAQRRDIA